MESRFGKLSFGLLLAMLLSTMIWAQDSINVDATDAEALRILMQEAGYVVTQDIDDDGDPRLQGQLSRSSYIVNFYGCRDGQNCTQLVFVSAWRRAGLELDKINAWNRDKIWGKAYLNDEAEPVLELALNMRHGVSSRNFLDVVDWWRITLEEFEKHIE